MIINDYADCATTAVQAQFDNKLRSGLLVVCFTFKMLRSFTHPNGIQQAPYLVWQQESHPMQYNGV
jgi:hypothetical protein